MGEFTFLSTSDGTRNHKRTRSYEVNVPACCLDAIAEAVRERPLWSGREVDAFDDGTSNIELTYGPVLGNAPSDAAKLLRDVVGIDGDDFSYPDAVDDGLCTDDCQHYSGKHYGR